MSYISISIFYIHKQRCLFKVDANDVKMMLMMRYSSSALIVTFESQIRQMIEKRSLLFNYYLIKY